MCKSCESINSSKTKPKQCADVNGEEEKRELKYNPKYLLGAKLLSEQHHPLPFQILHFALIRSKIVRAKQPKNCCYLLLVRSSMMTSNISAIIVYKQERDPIH